ncbi:MAG: Ni/Fe hydrogenase subunit alpha [Deltaproteobacteria bacterium]|nr:Ni/Fe hydrogenase subunit alpha [Deltaproteobacteria bacterium]
MDQRKITINPVSRVEGHGKVTIHLDDQGQVADARFHVVQFRGFEAFCRHRPYEEMPIITQRICGICPVSHQLASAKACDAILGQEIPQTARLLRELLHMGQYIQSHALHFFYLASPDLLLGWDSDPAKRNVVGVMAAFPEAAAKGIRLRKFGQEIIKTLAGKKIHPAYAMPGGVSDSLAERDRDRLLTGFKEAYETARLALGLLTGWLNKNLDEVKVYANFESNYAGLVDKNGYLNLYDGQFRLVDAQRRKLDEFSPTNYLDFIGEHVEPWSYLKFPFYKPAGFPDGFYRVGPLGRLNAATGITTPQAAAELRTFRELADTGLTGSSLMYHYARLVELIYALERAEELLRDERICHDDIRITANPSRREGVGVVEAPRGTLIHHYWVDRNGAIEKANLIVATGHNNVAMNRAVEAVAKHYIRDGVVKEGMLNRVEGAIRCYDPCLSCSTHALGQMDLIVQVITHSGELWHELRR